MQEYRYEKAIVKIHGSTPSDLKESTEAFLKKILIKKKGEQKCTEQMTR